MRLDTAEVEHATWVATRRQTLNTDRPDSYGFRGDGLAINIQGCLGELAVSKALNLHWSGVVENPFSLRGDVGLLQVRTTTHPNGRLLVHDRDQDDSVFVLVRLDLSSNECDLAGWVFGRTAKNRSWWEDPTGKNRHAYFVPNHMLDPIEMLDWS